MKNATSAGNIHKHEQHGNGIYQHVHTMETFCHSSAV